MSRANISGDRSTKKVFTTGEVASICNLSQQTIIRCFDKGRLGGFRVPGSRFRRIPRADLINFMQENSIPTTMLLDQGRRVLVVEPDSNKVGSVVAALTNEADFEVQVVDSEFDAGVMSQQFQPHIVVLGGSIKARDAVELCGRIKSSSTFEDPKVLVMSKVLPNDVKESGEYGVDGFIQTPFSTERLIICVNELLGD
jgi:two-component system OmpR family response regulator